MDQTSTRVPRLETRGLRKYFASSGVLAVADVSFEVWPGEVVAIIGENGTGKSTLMNLLFGVHNPDAGEILIEGEPRTIGDPQDAIAAGLGMVHQHFELVPSFTVAQNVLLGREPARLGLYDDKRARERVAQLAAESGLRIDPTRRVDTLSIGAQQRVEILKALAADAQTLIFDEPTAVLTPGEAEELTGLIRRLAAGGRSVLFISHKLPEVQAVADRIVVMRRGRVVATLRRGEADDAELARLMVGRDVAQQTEPPVLPLRATVLGVTGLRHAATPEDADGVQFEIRGGEILGIAGVSGNGQDELIEAIAGLLPLDAGAVDVRGVPVAGRRPARIREAGLAHIAADRMTVGLNLTATLEENVVATAFRSRRFSRLGVIARKARRAFAQQVIADYEVRGAAPARAVASLSGGNLQKIVIGRELAGEPAVVLANQPTRGLDVGSIEFVHRSLLAACAEGSGVLLVSTELDEVLALSHRIAVMYRGELIGPFARADVDRERIGRIMAGGKDAA
ncbi:MULTISPECIES: ABC transporter ATP-binding protein [Microbacterium]|uniref:ABC transporter ATP-binding protein n=1 Tax=Microbacterium TaxID=33882 RepID=UPI001996351F|nr:MULTISPECIES: ABC transporter ATP-binding protein [Microbacterium]MBD3758391.1 ABC transporter ATP-binding protein [Microbacterium sp.]